MDFDGEDVDAVVGRHGEAEIAAPFERGREVGVVDVAGVGRAAQRRRRERVPGAGDAVTRADRIDDDDALVAEEPFDEIERAGRAFLDDIEPITESEQ